MDFEPDYIVIPYQLIKNKKLQPLDRILYGVIYYFERMKEGKCIASNKTLAEYCRSDSASVQNSLLRLERERYILRIFKDKERKIRDEIKSLVSFTHQVSLFNDTLSSNNDTPIPVKNDTLSSNNDHINKSILIINNNNYTNKDKELTELLYDLVKQNYSFLVERKTEKQWEQDFEEMNKINRIDGRDYKIIEGVIRWCQQDSFWRQNIRSVSKLRKQFDSLLIRIKGNVEKYSVIDVDKMILENKNK